MPELPEVEIMTRNIQKWTKGASLVEVKGMAFPEKLLGKAIGNVSRRGKYCIIPIGEYSLLIHFRMTGKMLVYREEYKHVRVIMRFSNGMTLAFVDQRKFGTVQICDEEEKNMLLQKLGDEIWPMKRDAIWYKQKLQKYKKPIKTLLLQQDVFAGVGNIMANEVCHRLGIHPELPCHTLRDKHFQKWDRVVHEYVDAVIQEEGGDEIHFLSQGGKAPKAFRVYARAGEPCPQCATKISTWKFRGRATYACLHCQPKES